MAVLIDKIQPPTMIPKGGNYMFLHTNTFTIDIVPLVLEVHYFAGVILEYKGIIVKYAIKQSAKQMNKRRKLASFTHVCFYY